MTKISKKISFLIIYSLPLAVLTYTSWYWSSDYNSLVNWYKGLYPYFYKATTWDHGFFTENVKSQGNLWCIFALIASVIWIISARKLLLNDIPGINIKRKPVFEYTLIFLSGAFISFFAGKQFYAADEVFSAINFASIHPFQTLSYYPIPNNHMLFNFINGTLFFWSNDLVFTGRILSLVFYSLMLCFSWYFLKKWIASNLYRGMVLLTLAVLFPVWGYSGQARGYELVLLFSILSFFSVLKYHTESKKHFLIVYIFCNAGAMLTVPTYLYWWAGLILAALLLMYFLKKPDWIFISASIASGALTLMVYLPLLTFSGIASISANSAVEPEPFSLFYFIAHMNNYNYFYGLFFEWFCYGSNYLIIGFVLLLIPLLLFIHKQNKLQNRILGIHYFSVFIASLLMILLMKKMPFYRNLIAHAYLVILFILLSVIPFLQKNASKFVFILFLLFFISFTAFRNYHRMPFCIYYYDVKDSFQKLSNCKTDFSNAASVYLDEESFYWWYVLEKKYPERSFQIFRNRPSFAMQDYCIIPVNADILPEITKNYRHVETCDDFNIYKR